MISEFIIGFMIVSIAIVLILIFAFLVGYIAEKFFGITK